MQDWFNVDRAGLASLIASRGKAFTVFELVSNAYDAGATRVSVSLKPIDGVPFATLRVEDNSAEGWAELDTAFTMFGRSRRAGDAEKRGRFSLGEKLVLSLCRSAIISTMSGTVAFNETGRHNVNKKTPIGTVFEGEIRMTREELYEVTESVARMIPVAKTFFNGQLLIKPAKLAAFEVTLPSVICDDGEAMRPTMRKTTVTAYPADADGGEILEMGIPVCRAEFPWRLDVGQKVPMNMERDHVTERFRTALLVAATNAMAGTITAEQATETWAVEALNDSRLNAPAVKEIVAKRFGERAVVAVPGDVIANAQAEANGCTVIHGGALGAGAWANIRKTDCIPTTSAAFPTPRPMAQPGGAPTICPTCRQPVRA